MHQLGNDATTVVKGPDGDVRHIVDIGVDQSSDEKRHTANNPSISSSKVLRPIP